MNIQHAHINTASSDCDGPMYREYVVFMNDAELTEAGQEYNDFSEIHFRERILGSQVSLTALTDGREATVTITEHGFDYHETTDEGYRSARVAWCDDVCESSYSQRDVYAEMMGY